MSPALEWTGMFLRENSPIWENRLQSCYTWSDLRKATLPSWQRNLAVPLYFANKMHQATSQTVKNILRSSLTECGIQGECGVCWDGMTSPQGHECELLIVLSRSVITYFLAGEFWRQNSVQIRTVFFTLDVIEIINRVHCIFQAFFSS